MGFCLYFQNGMLALQKKRRYQDDSIEKLQL